MRNFKKALGIIVLVALLVPFASIGQDDGLLGQVVSRGNIICGVNTGVPGFGFQDEAGEFSGFDIDYCRAISVAVFGDTTSLDFRPTAAADRFTSLASGEIDVLVRNTTWTFTRDNDLGANFAPTTYYDGQGFMVRESLGVSTINELDGATVCVLQGTTTELNLADYAAAQGIVLEPLSFGDTASRDAAYDEGRCDALTSDSSQLAGIRTNLANPDEHVILSQIISKEPLGPVVAHGDDTWFDIVKWVVFCTFEAEELGVNSGNVDDQIANATSPSVRRLLGVESDLGSQLGLSNDFCANVIRELGNYGEIYSRNLDPIGLPRAGTLNALNGNGGLIYSPPFR